MDTIKEKATEIKVINSTTGPDTNFTNDQIATFLEKFLEQYGDPKEDILKCLDYVFDKNKGGFVILATQDDKIMGASIINETGMSGYIPENILVYIAVHRDARGLGIGKKLMKNIMEIANGSIALHVEENNPARFLYEKVGFESKYVEMRLTR
ncbi:GNAT family N-acetyltransferase [Limibacter armeniacum]|uniref:GNAT family N-acetyltransferase n=1 Tax=Limibacter armeniacum TaxID=466084 RepID=UPI002FE5AC25